MSKAMSEESLFEFPRQYAIKAIGKDNTRKGGSELERVVREIVHRHTPSCDIGAATSQLSKDGKYTAVTVMITASGKQHLDAIYQELSVHPLILVAL